MILLDVPAPCVDFRHAGDFSQFGFDHPIMEGPKFFKCPRGIIRAHDIVKNLTKTSGNGAKLWAVNGSEAWEVDARTTQRNATPAHCVWSVRSCADTARRAVLHRSRRPSS